MGTTKWTVDQDDKIIELRKKGLDWQKIAKKIGPNVTTSQVRHRFYLHEKSPKADKSSSVRVKQLERRVAELQSALDTARKPRIPFASKSSKSRSGDYIRVAIPDTHGSKVDRKALSALLADIEMLRPREVVLLGDHLDCGGFLATHHTLGYVAESAYTFEEDVSCCNQFLDDVQNRCQGASFHYLEGNHECLTPEHDVLTDKGWKSIGDVAMDDVVASMDDKGGVVWAKPLAVHSYDYTGDLVCLNGLGARIEMTPQHRVWYWSQNGKDLLCRKAWKILGTSTVYHLPVSAENNQPELVGYSDDELRLLGWLLTDGTLSSNKMTVYQSKPNRVNEIRELLNRMQVEFTESSRDRKSSFGGDSMTSYSFNVLSRSRVMLLEKYWGITSSVCVDKMIPDWVSRLSSRQFRVFFGAVLDGDGSRTGTASCLYGMLPFLEKMQALLVVNGFAASLSRRHRTSGGWYDCLNIKQRTKHKVDGPGFFAKKYSGKVHCLTTVSDNFFIRLRGRVSITGNSRIEKWIVTQTLANNRDASYLRRQFSPESVLFLEKRGIKYYERSKFHGDVPVPGTIRLGKCHFVHGSRTGTHSAMSMLRDFGGNVVYGHVHSMDSASLRTVHHGTISSWTPGCLCQLQPTYMHTQITRWNHGYALQFCRENGDFLHINVPIINGESYLAPLTKAIGV
jgi:Myb-like DNA-binding domain